MKKGERMRFKEKRKGMQQGVPCQRWILRRKVFWKRKQGVSRIQGIFCGEQLPHGNRKHQWPRRGELKDQDV